MKAKTIIMTTLATVVLAACSNDENNVINSGPSKATFTATIAGQVNTRVYDQTWNEGDLIGVSGMSGGVPYTNVQYETINGDGNFTISNPGDEIYFQDGNTVTFTAYYPWPSLRRTHLSSSPTHARRLRKTRSTSFGHNRQAAR